MLDQQKLFLHLKLFTLNNLIMKKMLEIMNTRLKIVEEKKSWYWNLWNKNIGGSSNGRTRAFGACNRGSSPCPPAKNKKLNVNTLGFYFSVGTGTRKTEATKSAVATAVAESGSRLFQSDGEEKSCDRVLVFVRDSKGFAVYVLSTACRKSRFTFKECRRT